ncbi:MULTISPECIES: nitrogen fixation protein NifZ [Methylobacter]|jgi:nitrogen fixation protein NifZ|uniref:nitrogen fixation protein NifZ n=1 Tax=Methylobacter TaxID=429 RepID=UPI0004080DA3|nr:nitrogen fixation protein NifZ [Methylobacter luteus]
MNPERFDEGRFEFGEGVRVTRNIRNDGTYPGLDVGHLLIRRGSVGNVVEVGTFLQDQVIFTVHFLDHGRMVGCRLEELISADEPWNPSRFEFRDKVVCTIDLGMRGEVLYPKGTEGEIFKVIRDSEMIQYHVNFTGRMLQVPESALAPAHPETFNEPEV